MIYHLLISFLKLFLFFTIFLLKNSDFIFMNVFIQFALDFDLTDFLLLYWSRWLKFHIDCLYKRLLHLRSVMFYDLRLYFFNFLWNGSTSFFFFQLFCWGWGKNQSYFFKSLLYFWRVLNDLDYFGFLCGVCLDLPINGCSWCWPSRLSRSV